MFMSIFVLFYIEKGLKKYLKKDKKHLF